MKLHKFSQKLDNLHILVRFDLTLYHEMYTFLFRKRGAKFSAPFQSFILSKRFYSHIEKPLKQN